VKLPRRWLLGLCLALAAAAWFGRKPVLRGLASLLVVDQAPAADDDLVLRGSEWGGGGHSFDHAAAWIRVRPTSAVLLMSDRPGRVAEIGVLASFESLARQELARRGVPDAAVSPIPGAGRDEWDEARLLQAWLHEHPDRSVAWASCRFNTRRLRLILDSVLGPEDAARVRVVALCGTAPDDIRTDNWWHSRDGVRQFMFAWLALVYARWNGEDRIAPSQQDVAAYEEMLQEAFRHP
jgi:hypothetical protein